MKPTLEAISADTNFTTLAIWVENKFGKKLIQEIKSYARQHHFLHLLLVTPEVMLYFEASSNDAADWKEHKLSTPEMMFKIGYLPRKNITDLTTQVISLLYFIKHTSSFQNHPNEILFNLYSHMFGEVDLYSSL